MKNFSNLSFGETYGTSCQSDYFDPFGAYSYDCFKKSKKGKKRKKGKKKKGSKKLKKQIKHLKKQQKDILYYLGAISDQSFSAKQVPTWQKALADSIPEVLRLTTEIVKKSGKKKHKKHHKNQSYRSASHFGTGQVIYALPEEKEQHFTTKK